MKVLKFDYDKIGDCLYAFYDKPQKAKSYEYGENILIRRDIHTNEIVGFTIILYGKEKAKKLFKRLSKEHIYIRDSSKFSA